jgi:hypothetical protein
VVGFLLKPVVTMYAPRLALATAACLAGLSASNEANASDRHWFLGLEGYTGWLREAPTMTLHSDSAPRDVIGLSVPPTSGVGFAGTGADVGFGDDKLLVRLLHLRFAQGFTSYNIGGMTEGTPVALATSSTSLFEASFFPFDVIGLRVKMGNGFRFQALPDVGVGVAWGSVHVTGAPSGSATYTFDNAYFYVRAELDACGRMAETHWVCLSLQPNLLQVGSAFPTSAFNGGTIGLRVEI